MEDFNKEIKRLLDKKQATKDFILEEVEKLKICEKELIEILRKRIKNTYELWGEDLKTEEDFYNAIPHLHNGMVDKFSITRYESRDFSYHLEWLTFLFMYKDIRAELKIPVDIKELMYYGEDPKELYDLHKIKLYKVISKEGHSITEEIGNFDGIYDALMKLRKEAGVED